MDIIKKIAAIILAAALCLGGAALAEETPEVTPGDFLDEWVDLDGTCRIEIAEHMAEESVDGYVVNVHMPVIAEESYSYVTWAYGCVWDDETQTLKSISRVTGKGDYEPDSEEEITDINYEYSDTAFYFKDGMLIWDDKNETADDGLRFKRPIGWNAPAPADYLGEWVDLDGTCNIDITEHTDGEIIDGYVVNVHMPVIAEESYSYVTWAYGCVWDDETQTLKSISRVTGKGDYEPDSEEEITDINYEYSDTAFYFKDGMLIWDDKNETADDGLRFERPIGWGEAYMPAEAAAFEGVWQCDRATIAMYWEEEGFKVLITWGSSAWEHTEWEYSCFYHDEDHTLVSMPFGTRTEVVYDENGEQTSATEVYNDGEAIFSLDEEGKLIWLDEKENAGDGMRFEKLPEEPAVLSFATIGEAMASEGFTGVIGGDDQHYVVAMEKDGAYIRLVADLDDEARRLGEATLEYVDADTLEAAFNAYNEYVKTLPVAYEEEITAAPLTQEELDALAGKTLQELEDAGYEHVSSEMGENDEATYTVSLGLYEYNLLLNETYTVYQQHDDSGFIGDLTVKSAAFAGLSRNAAELRYHADGTYDAEKDGWAEFNGIMDLISQAMSGENPEEAIQKLIEAMPEHAEEIRTFAEIFSSISDQNQK